MKKCLWISLAALGFVACEKGIDNDNPQNGEMEKSYVAVSLMADDMTTRATGDVYEDGEDYERNVKSLYFFLFDKAGNAFPIDGNKNYKSVSVNETGNAPDANAPENEGEPNVSDVKNKVLVFENYKGEYPAKIVAVLNWTPATDAAYSLDALATQIIGLRNAENEAFVMSNAVYVSESNSATANKETIRATALSAANIAKSATDAQNNPVQIYVERIAAKVTVSTTAENKYAIGEEIDGTTVYAKVTGWDLYNEYDQSYLLKKVNPNWTSTTVGFNWNDAAWFRSYWAESPTTAFTEDNKVSYNSLTNAIAGNDYCGENTYRAEGERTKVVVKALLVDENEQPVEVATWYGNDYITKEALLTVVANTLASQLYYMDGEEYKSIEPNHLMVKEAFVENNPNTSAVMEAYHVFFQLSDDGKAKEWHTYSAAEGFNAATDEDIDVILGGVEPALLYKGGQTYYYTDIKHLPSTVADTQYGVVRNHVYKVNIGSITGFGTPVYNGNTKFDPEEPAEITTYVSAEVRVLSWRVVDHNYDL